MQPHAPNGARWRCSHTHSRPKCSASTLHVGGTGKRLVNCRSRQTPVASHLHERPAHGLHRAAAAAEVEHDPVQPLLQTWQQNLVPRTRWRWRPLVLLQGADCRCCSRLNSTGLFHGLPSPLSPRTCGPCARMLHVTGKTPQGWQQLRQGLSGLLKRGRLLLHACGRPAQQARSQHTPQAIKAPASRSEARSTEHRSAGKRAT